MYCLYGRNLANREIFFCYLELYSVSLWNSLGSIVENGCLLCVFCFTGYIRGVILRRVKKSAV